MTSSFKTVFKLIGDPEQLRGMLGIVGQYSEEAHSNWKKNQYFLWFEANKKKLDFSCIPDDILTGGCLTLEASGPYGYFPRLEDVGVFRDLADLFPQAAFQAEISGCTTYDVQNLKCELKDGLLYIETFSEGDFEKEDAWVEDFIECLPLKSFKSLFQVKNLKGQEFGVDNYRNLIYELGVGYYDDMLSEMEFDVFAENLEDFGGKTELKENEFSDIMKNKLEEFGIVSREDFEYMDGGEKCTYIYDPRKKAYVHE